MKNEDFAWLNEKKQDDEFAKDIISRLLGKITELEKTVTGHATSGTFLKQNSGAVSDTQSNFGFDRQSSVGSFQHKLGASAINKLK